MIKSARLASYFYVMRRQRMSRALAPIEGVSHRATLKLKVGLGMAVSVVLGAGISCGLLVMEGGADTNGSTSAPAALRNARSAVQVAEQTSYVSNVTRVQAKETTFADLESGAFSAGGVVNSPEAATSDVWVVALAGTVHPTFDESDQSFSWGVEVFDAGSGRSIAAFAGSNGSWPPYFDNLPDISRTAAS